MMPSLKQELEIAASRMTLGQQQRASPSPRQAGLRGSAKG